jgi:hypothetical protein
MSLAKSGTSALRWRKARHSIHNGDCVEVSPARSEVFVRDSKDPGGVMLGYPASTWRTFVFNAKNGEFDALKLLTSS